MEIIELLKSKQFYARITIGYRWVYYENGVWIVMEQKYRQHTHQIYNTTNLEEAIDILIEEEQIK